MFPLEPPVVCYYDWETDEIEVAYHTPARFPIHVIERIRQGTSMLFQSFGLRDFAKIDGWFVPNHVNLIPTLGKDIKFGLIESGTILFTDINLVSSMEQTSFLEIQEPGICNLTILKYA